MSYRFLRILKHVLGALIDHSSRNALATFVVMIAFATLTITVCLAQGIKKQADILYEQWGPLCYVAAWPEMEGVLNKGTDVTSLNHEDIVYLNRAFSGQAIFYRDFWRKGATLQANGRRMKTTICLVDANGWKANRRGVIAGGAISAEDFSSSKRLCLIGETVRKRLFQDNNPVGRRMRIDGVPFHVKGLLKPLGRDWANEDMDNFVYVPMRAGLARLYPGKERFNIGFIVKNPKKMEDVCRSVARILKDRHIRRGLKGRYWTQSPERIAASYRKSFRSQQIIAWIITLIALVLSGFMISNFLILFVKQQEKEIGLKRALGARRQDVIAEFFFLACLIVVVGASLGFLIGLGVAHWLSLSHMIKGTSFSVIPTTVDAWTIAWVFLGCAFLALGSAIGPARHASQVEVVNALSK